MKKETKQLKLTPPEIIQVWNALFDLEAINDTIPASIQGFIQRFRVYAKPEVEAWNSMDEDTRIAISAEQIIFPVSAPAEPHLQHIETTASIIRDLQPAFGYSLESKKSKLAELVEKAKSQTNGKEQITEKN